MQAILPFIIKTWKTARAYVLRYNNILKGEGHASLAKVRIGANYYGKNRASVSVVAPLKTIGFDIGRPHYVSLRRASVRAWVKSKWNYLRARGRSGWFATQQFAGKSMVKGSRSNPKGTIFVLSHEDKFGWSIQDQATDVAIRTVAKELSEFVNRRIGPKIRSNLKARYSERFVFTI